MQYENQNQHIHGDIYIVRSPSAKPSCSCYAMCQLARIQFAVYVVVGHRAIGLLQILVTSPCRGGAAEIYN